MNYFYVLERSSNWWWRNYNCNYKFYYIKRRNGGRKENKKMLMNKLIIETNVENLYIYLFTLFYSMFNIQ